MPKKEVPLNALSHYLPDGTYDSVARYLHQYKVHLTIAKSRNSILGDFRNQCDAKNHRISVNGNLNKYAFLVTLLHELAHLLTYEKHGRKVLAHGKEWKDIYGQVLARFINKNIFPADIEEELKRTLQNPGASTCAEEGLQRILYRYDEKKNGYMLVEQVPQDSGFILHDGRKFIKGPKRRTRYLCCEVSTGRNYLFSSTYEVKIVE